MSSRMVNSREEREVEDGEEETRMDRWTVQSRESGYRADVITAAARDQSWFADLFLPPVCFFYGGSFCHPQKGRRVTPTFLGVSSFLAGCRSIWLFQFLMCRVFD